MILVVAPLAQKDVGMIVVQATDQTPCAVFGIEIVDAGAAGTGGGGRRRGSGGGSGGSGGGHRQRSTLRGGTGYS